MTKHQPRTIPIKQIRDDDLHMPSFLFFIRMIKSP